MEYEIKEIEEILFINETTRFVLDDISMAKIDSDNIQSTQGIIVPILPNTAEEKKLEKLKERK